MIKHRPTAGNATALLSNRQALTSAVTDMFIKIQSLMSSQQIFTDAYTYLTKQNLVVSQMLPYVPGKPIVYITTPTGLHDLIMVSFYQKQIMLLK